MGVTFQNHKIFVSVIQHKTKEWEKKINGQIHLASQIIMPFFYYFFLSHIESYTRIGPVVDYPKTVDYIWERTLIKYQQTKTAVFFLSPPPTKKLWEAFSNRTVHPSRFVSGAYLLYSLRKELKKLVCGCILGWRSVATHFRITVTLIWLLT